MNKEMSAVIPEWYDGKKINEVMFCDAFLEEYPMKCIRGQFFTVDGLVDDENMIRMEIYKRIKPFVTSSVAKKATQLMEALKLACYSEPLPVQLDRIHVANGTYFLDGTFSPEKEFCMNRLRIAYNPDAPAPTKWLAFLHDLLMDNTSKSGNPWGYLDRNRPRNIVFYGRVSTEHEAQLSALENQMQWYDDQLRYHPNWTVVGKYIDEGITGTQAKKRPAFLRMLEDARAGKFDLIVTREVCRFARNTVDTLVHTRELKNIGVEVYFVEDNIWTMDGDGELRLSLMATLAQEESRKVSERVRAGQKVSREKGTLYGSGNILGYERVGSTYVINPDQAETVRMIFEMYLNEGIGTGKIANRLTEMGRLNASGINKWSHGVVSRVLNNQTYMGIMAYGKSYNNNYLDQKRVNNHDKSSYICVEGDFPPIVTPEEWYRAQEIKAGRVKESFSAKKGKKTTHCVQENRDLWGSRLRCTCGCGFRKNVWHKYDDKPNTYGYQCYNILNNGSANQRRKAGADDTGYCDQPMIADWKLELMGKKILELVFQDKRDLIDHTCDMIRKCLQTARPQGVTLSNIVGKMERIKFKKEMLLEMRTDGEITKQEFLDQRKKLDKELQELQAEYDSKAHSPAIDLEQPEWGRIQDALEEILDLSQPKPSPDLIRKFVTQVVPIGKTNFCWYLNLDGRGTTAMDMTVEGRKNHANLTFGGEHYAPHEESGIIDLKNACLCTTPHRLLSRMAGTKELPEVCKPNRETRGRKSVYVQLEQ